MIRAVLAVTHGTGKPVLARAPVKFEEVSNVT
jgi:hypothetical protein